MQLRQTLALWTSASRLPGDRRLLKMNGDILWTQQRSTGVRYERRKGAWCTVALATADGFTERAVSCQLYLLLSWAWWDWPLTWLTNHVLQCYDIVCWVIRLVKSSPEWPIMCRVGRWNLLYYSILSKKMLVNWDVRNRFFLFWFGFGFWKNSDSLWTKCGSVWLKITRFGSGYYSYLLFV